MIATTLNIHRFVLSRIACAAEKLGISRRRMIVILLMRMMVDKRLHCRGFTTVKYQDDDLKENWHCFHIRFREDENEFFVDLRKFSKFSVSCLLAMAVKRFLNEIIENTSLDVDKNIIFKGYVLHHEIYDGIFTWHIYWGYQGEHIQRLRL